MVEDLTGAFEVRRLSVRRLMTIDGLDAASQGHRTVGLVEFDVTAASRRIELLRVAGRRLTLVSFVVACIARALAEHPALNSVRQGRSVYRFADVDVNLSVELPTADGDFPHQVTIRRAQERDAESVYAEIERAREQHAVRGGAGVEDRRLERAVRLLGPVPRPVRVGVLRWATRSALRVKRWSGTTFVTSVTRFARGGGFVVPWAAGPVAVSFALGGTRQAPACHDGVHETRRLLAVTVLVNHDLVDGAPAARFVGRLQELVETADGLPDAGPGLDPQPPVS